MFVCKFKAQISTCNPSKWSVAKITANKSGYSYALSDEKTEIIADSLDKWNANYVVNICEYLYRAKKIQLNSLAELNDDLIRTIDIDRLAYHYAIDSFGEGWSLNNGYKLKSNDIIDMWLAASIRHGIIPLDSNSDDVYNALKNAIQRIIDTYMII